MCVSVCVCVCRYIYKEREIYYKILAHAIMNTEKSHYWPSTSRMSRKAVDVVQRFESQRADGVDFSLGLNV